MMPPLRLLRDQCFVRLAPTVPRESGLIEVPAMPLPPSKGKVLQVGPQCCDVKVGDVVLIDTEAIAHDVGEPLVRTPHLIVSETGLLAVLERA